METNCSPNYPHEEALNMIRAFLHDNDDEEETKQTLP